MTSCDVWDFAPPSPTEVVGEWLSALGARSALRLVAAEFEVQRSVEFVIQSLDDHLPRPANALDNLRCEATRIASIAQREAALALLEEVKQELEGITGVGAWTITETDDGAVVMECLAPGKRLGFVLEREAAESSWYLVSPSAQATMTGLLRTKPSVRHLYRLFGELQ